MKKHTQISLLAVLLIGIAACKPLQSPALTPERTSETSISAGIPELDLVWSQEIPNNWRGHQALVTQNIMVFSNFGLTPGGSPDTTVVAGFDLNTREVLWSVQQEPLIPMQSNGSTVFLLTREHLAAVSATSGATLWETDSKTSSVYSDDELLVKEQHLFYGHHNEQGNNELSAFDAQTGNVLWEVVLKHPLDRFKSPAGPLPWHAYYNTMAYNNDVLYTRTYLPKSASDNFEFAIIAISAQTGETLWEFPFETPATHGDNPPGGASQLAFDDQAVYFGTFGGTAYALQQDTGEVIWQKELAIDFNPTFVNGQIVTYSGYQSIKAFDSQTGQENWQVPVIDDAIGSLSPFVFYNNYLIFYASDGNKNQLSIVDIETGNVVQKAFPNLPEECGKAFPVDLTLPGNELYLVCLQCVHQFHLSLEE